MRHRIKKIPTLKHLLHSDKSTYFYTSKVKGFFKLWRFDHYSPNDVRWTSPHHDMKDSPAENARVNWTRSSRAMTSYSRIAGRTNRFIRLAPICVSNALLLVLGMLIFPVGMSGGGEKVYAETINYPAVEGNNNAASISFTLNDANIDGNKVSTEVIPDEISYISNNLKVTTNNIGKFAITIQSASDNGNLVNSDNGAIIAPITSSTIPANFANNTWGYALSDETSKADAELTYNPLPAFQETPTAQYNKDKPADGDYNLKLVFAAKIGSNKPAGHYQTTALVSVVAEAKTVTLPFDGITTMQQMTSTICNNASENDSAQLKDTRNDKTYTVTKLKGNAGRWMTKNMEYNNTVYYDSKYGNYYQHYGAKESCNLTGWQLPTKNQYQALLDTYGIEDNPDGSKILRSAPLNFKYGGFSSSGYLNGAGIYGSYWSATVADSNNASYLTFNKDHAYLGEKAAQISGYSVRCVAK